MEAPIDRNAEFWAHFVDCGAIDADLAREFQDTAHQTWVPLGQILVERRVLEMSTLMSLLAMQADEPSVRIGDLAIREGHATHAEVEEALAEQRRRSPGPVELMIADKRVEARGVLGPLLNYLRFLEGKVRTLQPT